MPDPQGTPFGPNPTGDDQGPALPAVTTAPDDDTPDSPVGPPLFPDPSSTDEAPAGPASPVDHLSLAARWRPRTFATLTGQRHIAAVLKSAAKSGHPPQQILLSGGSGLGKTTVARIFAAALSCENPPGDGDACGTCGTCEQITGTGSHPDVVEIDAASHGGKDEINQIAARAATAPMLARWKVYIVDEAHGITRAGSEAFLKLLEEPPPHVLFVLATTDPDKMLRTIIGRCQQLAATAPTRDELIGNLQRVATGEGWNLTDALAATVVDCTDPALGVRGTVNGLAKLASLLETGGPVDEDLVATLLGTVTDSALTRLGGCIDQHDPAGALAAAEELAGRVGDQALRAALLRWARRRLRAAATGDETLPVAEAARRVALFADAGPGAVWTELAVARAAIPDVVDPAAVEATQRALTDAVTDAHKVIGELREMLSQASHHPRPDRAPDNGTAARPTPSSDRPRQVPARDEPVEDRAPLGEPPPELDDGPPPEGDPWFDNPDAADTRPEPVAPARPPATKKAAAKKAATAKKAAAAKKTAAAKKAPAAKKTTTGQARRRTGTAPSPAAAAALSQQQPAPPPGPPVPPPLNVERSLSRLHSLVDARSAKAGALLAACQMRCEGATLVVVVPAELTPTAAAPKFRAFMDQASREAGFAGVRWLKKATASRGQR